MKEYIVVANDEPSIDQLHLELTNDTTNNNSINGLTIPNRPVEVANPRLANPRITHYFLTDEEAKALSNDTRVTAINPKPNKNLLTPHTVEPKFLKKTQSPVSFNGHKGLFNRVGGIAEYSINWGLRRTSLKMAENKPEGVYNYDVDGSGVDIIILDDGLQSDHPEFYNESGRSRVHEIDWYKWTGLPGSMPPRHYRLTGFFQGYHGTHVAAIAAGKTFGYAKNSRIYYMRLFNASDDQIIDISDAFDLIRVWHTKKPLDKETGSRRPTVVNMSFGYSGLYNNNTSSPQIKSLKYRNEEIQNFDTPVNRQEKYGQVSDRHGYRVPSIDIEVEMCEDVGVVFVHSAGNFSHKIDKVGGKDYDNYYKVSGTWMDDIPEGEPIYYHRGCSPVGKNTIVVSAGSDVPIQSSGSLKERIEAYSERGPGCDVVAPGNNIMSASTNRFGTKPYVWMTTKETSFKVAALGGTSQAGPQVAGVVALYLSRHPAATPAEVKKWIQTTSVKDQILTKEIDDEWANLRSLLGGPNLYLYNPFHNGYRD